jgi:hypothetical protein
MAADEDLWGGHELVAAGGSVEAKGSLRERHRGGCDGRRGTITFR